jgi:hypothetical protein
MKQKRIFITLALAILLITGVGVLVWSTYNIPRSNADYQSLTTTQNSNDINYDEPTPEQVDTGNTAKQNTINTDKDHAQTNGSSSVPITVSATSVSPEKVSLRFMIEGLHKGRCSLVLTGPSGATVSVSADTQLLASTSTCKGFDVNTSTLSTGKWIFTMSASFEDSSNGKASGEFTL